MGTLQKTKCPRMLKWGCPVCRKILSSKMSVTDHMKLHNVEELIQCPKCHKRYATTKALEKHLMCHSREELPYLCIVCHKRFCDRSSLKRHSVVHTNKKPYECTECSKRFTVRSNLTRHKKIHAGFRTQPCPVCGRTFAENLTLSIHMNQQHPHGIDLGIARIKPRSNPPRKRSTNGQSDGPRKMFQCIVCGRECTTKSGLNKHILIHSGLKCFSCPVCGNTFSENGSLKRHYMRLHTGNCPFQCPECPRKFTVKEDLVFHMRRHTDEKKKMHVCSICKKPFRTNGKLKHHLIIHARENSYQCDICGCKFRQQSTLKQHLSSHDRELFESDMEDNQYDLIDNGDVEELFENSESLSS